MKVEGKEIQTGHFEHLPAALKAARDHFLMSDYGKFDLIQALLPVEMLLSSKPRIIKKMICEKFGLLTGEINNDTFWSWLRRIRKGPLENIPFASEQQPVEITQNDDQEIDWKNFIPSTPRMDTAVTKSIIKLVAPTK